MDDVDVADAIDCTPSYLAKKLLWTLFFVYVRIIVYFCSQKNKRE